MTRRDDFLRFGPCLIKYRDRLNKNRAAKNAFSNEDVNLKF